MVLNYELFEGDLLNKERRRNVGNTDKSEYNCGGYALEVFNWYLPYERKYRYDLFSSMYSTEERLEIMVNFMLEEFKGELRIIDKIEDLKNEEYAIAFRTGKNDFHYIKRADNGHWFHKMGGTHRIDTMTKDEVLNSESWRYGEYCSKVVLLAKLK